MPIKVWLTPPQQSIRLYVNANGTTLFVIDYSSPNQFIDLFQITGIKLSENEWFVNTQSLGLRDTRLVNIDPTSGLTIQVQASPLGGSATKATVGTLIVEYDVD